MEQLGEHANGLMRHPAVGLSSSKKLNLGLDGERVLVQHWISFYRPGPIDGEQLLNMSQVEMVCEKAATIGIEESTPTMLVNNKLAKPYQLYLFQWEQGPISLPIIETNLAGFSQKELALYLPPGLIQTKNFAATIHPLVRWLLLEKGIEELTVMLAEHTYSAMLSQLVELKNRLENDGADILIFH